jgi:serine protease Do
VVTVTSYVPFEKTPENRGRWEVADESPHPFAIRHLVASGIVVGDQGTVLCCRTPLTVPGGGFATFFDVETADGGRFDAELIASEPTINIAILRIKETAGLAWSDSLRPIEIGDAEAVEAGDTVYAVADPFGSSRTFAPGVIMAVPTVACYQADLTGSFLHASVAVSPGAVGGALVDRDGKAIGLIVPPPSLDPEARPAPEPFVTYAMQIGTVLGVAEALEAKRTNHSPWVGFSVRSRDELKAAMRDQAAFERLAKPAHGIVVDDLYEPSPASKAGVRRGDWVLDVGGRKIMGVLDFQQALYYFSGTTVPIRFFRDGEESLRMVAIETRPPEANR